MAANPRCTAVLVGMSRGRAVDLGRYRSAVRHAAGTVKDCEWLWPRPVSVVQCAPPKRFPTTVAKWPLASVAVCSRVSITGAWGCREVRLSTPKIRVWPRWCMVCTFLLCPTLAPKAARAE